MNSASLLGPVQPLRWCQDEQGPSPVPITCPLSLVCAPGEGVRV